MVCVGGGRDVEGGVERLVRENEECLEMWGERQEKRECTAEQRPCLLVNSSEFNGPREGGGPLSDHIVL